MTDWQTAPAADGPKLMAWVDANLPIDRLAKGDPGLDRRVRDWRKGSRAGIFTIDRLLNFLNPALGLHDLPDDIWVDRVHAPAGTGAQPSTPPKLVVVTTRFCANCGDPIPQRDSNGKLCPSHYARRKFCSRACGHEAQAGTGQSRSPEFNARLLSREEPFETATEDDPVYGEQVA